MDQDDAVVAVFDTHAEADAAVKKLASDGFAMKQLSLIGKGYHTEETVAGFYNVGDRVKFSRASRRRSDHGCRFRHPRSGAGIVASVRGAVVDVDFADGALPPIDTALLVDWDRPEPLVLEVHSHVATRTIRGIAMQATAGLSRGTGVRATSKPITVPVGDAVLGRLLDVLGTLGTVAHPCRRTGPRAASTAVRRR